MWRAGTALGAIALGALIYASVASVARDNTMARLKERNALFSATLSNTLERFQHLPEVLSESPTVSAALGGDVDFANTRLKALAVTTGLEAIYLMNRFGETVAASNFDSASSFLGQNYGFRPYFKRAISGDVGDFYAIGATTSKPGYFVAGPVVRSGETVGALAVKVDLQPLTTTWSDSGEIVLAANADGVVVLSAIDQYRYRALADIDEARRAEIANERQFGAEPLTTLEWRSRPDGSVTVGGARHLVYSKPIDQLGWTLHVLQPLNVVDKTALTALIAYFVVIALAGVAFFYARSRRIGAALKTSLTERDALARLNERLEAEISERTAAEAALQQTQDELSRASRLAALGKMAATVTHELGQPLGAMRNYLAAADIAASHQDLPKQLTPIVERMANTTKALRTFARGDKAGMELVDLRQVLNAAKTMNQHDIAANSVELSITERQGAMVVKGNPLRLEQVFTNLMLNAVQAVVECEVRRIEIGFIASAGEIRVSVGDSGMGLGDASLDVLAEPFHTTRAAGMGLGLSICKAIVHDHGGRLEVGQSPLGGAELAVVLPLEESPK